MWDCRRNKILPKIKGFKTKICLKYEIESKINKEDLFKKKWTIFFD